MVSCNEVYNLSGPSLKHGQPEDDPSLFHSVLNWDSLYFCEKIMSSDVNERKVIAIFLITKKDMVPNQFFDQLQLFWSKHFFDQAGAKKRFCTSEIY